MRSKSHSLSIKPKQVDEVARDLRIYAGAVMDAAMAAKLLAAAAELDARQRSPSRAQVEE